MNDGDDTSLGGGDLESGILSRIDVKRDSPVPPLPNKIAIEINNSCNHKCFFCPNPIMVRQRQVMSGAKVRGILDDARGNGIREVSFYSTGEPLLHKELPEFIRYAKEIGFSYVFLSTNGGRAVTKRIPAVLEAGLDSLKFSVNGGDRDTYALVHGEDDFDVVMENIETVDRYRRQHGAPRLFVSFVDTPMSAHGFDKLRVRLEDVVDEIARYPFVVIGTPLVKRNGGGDADRPTIGYEDVDRGVDLNRQRTSLPCYQLWSYLNVMAEGYLSACCSDFNDDLVVANLHDMSLADAWHSPEFQKFRRRHIEGEILGTLCEGCVMQKERPYAPINMHLHTQDRENDGSEGQDTAAEHGTAR